MTMNLWDPLRDLVSVREAMDRLFEESFVPATRQWIRERRGPARLPLDVYTTPDEIVVLAPIPGVKPEDVEITLEGEVLTIRGEIKAPIENVDYIMQERWYGPFSRTLSINVPVNADKVEATFENGLLTLVIPKAEEVKPKTIKVQAKK
ncbi:MAG: Hsp20/alpha crystallin family protein [Anaerolineae bacterium]